MLVRRPRAHSGTPAARCEADEESSTHGPWPPRVCSHGLPAPTPAHPSLASWRAVSSAYSRGAAEGAFFAREELGVP
eukprot:5150109-Pyramimonas_sp.AAC.1